MSPATAREATSDTVRGLRLHTQVRAMPTSRCIGWTAISALVNMQAAEVAKRLLRNSTNAADVNIRDSQVGRVASQHYPKQPTT